MDGGFLVAGVARFRRAATSDLNRLRKGKIQHKANTCSIRPAGYTGSVMASEELVVHGAREHNLKDVTVRLPRNKLICITGLSRLREVVAGVRHDLRRGPAAVRREPLRLRAPVPPDDGEAGRRLDRRPLAGDLDRPEDDVAQPALDGRHGHRDLRLPAPALRARRPAALPGLRQADLRPEPGVDRRPDPAAAGAGRSSPSTRRSSATARASTRTSSRSSETRASRA